MGFFSWRCAVSGLPILADTAPWPDDLKHLCKVVMLTKKGWIKGSTDGYGRLMVSERGGRARLTEVPENLAEVDDLRLVLQSVWKNEAHADVEASENEPNQGFFWDHDQLREIVNGLYPYPHTVPGREELLAILAGHPDGVLLKEALQDRDGTGSTRRALEPMIAAAVAVAESAGRRPADDPLCTALRDARTILGDTS